MITRFINNALICAKGSLKAAETTPDSIVFEPSNFIENLSYMGSGMLGIFVVIGIIVGITYILNTISNKR